MAKHTKISWVIMPSRYFSLKNFKRQVIIKLNWLTHLKSFLHFARIDKSCIERAAFSSFILPPFPHSLIDRSAINVLAKWEEPSSISQKCEGKIESLEEAKKFCFTFFLPGIIRWCWWEWHSFPLMLIIFTIWSAVDLSRDSFLLFLMYFLSLFCLICRKAQVVPRSWWDAGPRWFQEVYEARTVQLWGLSLLSGVQSHSLHSSGLFARPSLYRSAVRSPAKAWATGEWACLQEVPTGAVGARDPRWRQYSGSGSWSK